MSALTDKINAGIKTILERAATAAADGFPDQIVVQLLFDGLLLAFLEEAPITETQLALLSGAVGRSGLHRLAGIADQARAAGGSSSGLHPVLARICRAWDAAGMMGFVCKNREQLVEMMTAIAEAKKLCGIDTPTRMPRPGEMPPAG